MNSGAKAHKQILALEPASLFEKKSPIQQFVDNLDELLDR